MNRLLVALVALSTAVALSAAANVQQWELEIPRVTAAELASNATLRTGHHAYILTGVASEWPAMKRWTLDYMHEKIPTEWVDYYPENMYSMEKKPYVQRYEEALQHFTQPSDTSRYMQLRLSLEGWEALKSDITAFPEAFWTEEHWIDSCMRKPDGERDAAAIDNFFRVNQWNFLLIGEKGTGIFFHRDHLAAASWQAHIKGRKTWVLCPFTQNKYFETAGNIFALDADYEKSPQFADALCGKVTAQESEILYYPAYWWHMTEILDTPSIGMTGLMVGIEDERPDIEWPRVHEQFYHDLVHKCEQCYPRKTRSRVAGSFKRKRICDDISTQWPGAAPPISFDVCNKYITRCYKAWDTKKERDAKLAASAGETQPAEPQSSYYDEL